MFPQRIPIGAVLTDGSVRLLLITGDRHTAGYLLQLTQYRLQPCIHLLHPQTVIIQLCLIRLQGIRIAFCFFHPSSPLQGSILSGNHLCLRFQLAVSLSLVLLQNNAQNR